MFVKLPEILNLANSTVSKHLSILRDAEFILDEKDGKWVNYFLNDSKNNVYVTKLLPLISDWCLIVKSITDDRKKVEVVDRNIICRA